jgi:hypothetical protein
VYNHGGGILENCDSPRYMIHHVAGYVTCTFELQHGSLRLHVYMYICMRYLHVMRCYDEVQSKLRPTDWPTDRPLSNLSLKSVAAHEKSYLLDVPELNESLHEIRFRLSPVDSDKVVLANVLLRRRQRIPVRKVI